MEQQNSRESTDNGKKVSVLWQKTMDQMQNFLNESEFDKLQGGSDPLKQEEDKKRSSGKGLPGKGKR